MPMLDLNCGGRTIFVHGEGRHIVEKSNFIKAVLASLDDKVFKRIDIVSKHLLAEVGII